MSYNIRKREYKKKINLSRRRSRYHDIIHARMFYRLFQPVIHGIHWIGVPAAIMLH